MKKYWLRGLSLVTALVFHGVASGEDIDLFAGYNPRADVPNVLIILDNSANWSAEISVGNCYYKDGETQTDVGPDEKEQGKKMAIEKCALYNTINALPTGAGGAALFNVGFMLFNESPASNSSGYPRQAFLPLTESNKAVLKSVIANLNIEADKGNNAAFAKSLHEAYLYFKGETPYKGTAGTKWDADAVSNGKYVSPSINSCGRNHIIFIANGGPGESTNGEAQALLSGLLGAEAKKIDYPTSFIKKSDQDNWADEYARFMRGSDVSNKNDAQGIITHGVAVTGASSDGTYPNFISAMADQGYGGFYTASDVDALTLALLETFSSIQAVNSVFASASLPISVNTQGTYLNQVFIGMFRPDGEAAPRWSGNLKQYQFVAGLAEGGGYKLYLGDADKKPAISDAGTGFIASCARSFWTPKDPDSYWLFRPSGSCINFEQSNSPDGEIVEKGAAGHLLRLGGLTPSTRKVLTCNGCTSGDVPLQMSEISAANSGLDSTLVDWLRGADNTIPPEKSGNTAENMRPSVHGDVVHSRPVAVNYGGPTAADANVVVFYGANDGMLRAVNGNTDEAGGNELWSFVASEHYDKFERLRSNSPEVFYPGTPTSGATRKDYFFDGPITAYKDASNTWIYATMRRGGNAVYAFDVTKPAEPKFKWKHDGIAVVKGTKTNNIGQTWSAPKVLKAAGYATAAVPAVPKPMIIMGGGYDTCEDGTKLSDLNTCNTVTNPPGPRGNKVYVLDADTGEVLKTLDTDRSVAGDVTVVPDSVTGLAKFAYAADTGGNIYRINIGSLLPTDWTIHKIASLGCENASCPGGVANRKFLFGPEVVVGSTYNTVLIGSGDREHPLASDLNTVSVDNAFFMIKDDTSIGDPVVVSLDQGVLINIDPESTGLTTEQQAALDSDANKGWYLQFGMDDPVHDKEQVVTSSVAVFGVVTFSTHTPTLPDDNSCSTNLGTARVYNIQYVNAAPVGLVRYAEIEGGGLPPSPVAGLVTVDKPEGAGGTGTTITVPFIIGADPRSPIEVKLPPNLSSDVTYKSRVYWYISNE